MSGKRKELVKKLPADTPGGQKGVEFASEAPRDNIFACPDHSETIKATGADSMTKKRNRRLLKTIVLRPAVMTTLVGTR